VIDMRRAPSPISCPLPGLDPEGYARWRGSTLGAITEELERGLVLELVGDVSGKRVLEIGCGDGALAVELTRRGASMTAIDASEAMITAAKQRANASSVAIDFRVAAAQDLPFASGQFDLIVAFTILCFVEDAAPVFGEIARVLRPSGRLVIGELNRWSTWAAERRVRAWFGSALWRRGHFRSPRQLRRLALDAGLTPGPVIGAVYYPRSALAARWMSPFERRLQRFTTLGAAFLALSAVKPGGDVA
jgi:SAM-dependent methyltransferase